MSRFFIALIPPKHILDHVNQVKQHFADNYNSRSALKSPPHITLQPPFEWDEANVNQLEQYLTNFASSRTQVPITLNQYGAFPPRVIYIDVLNTPELTALQLDLITYSIFHVTEVQNPSPCPSPYTGRGKEGGVGCTLFSCNMLYMESIDICDPNTKSRTFTPHMTVAFRDLTEQNFKVAWQEFEHRQVNFEFIADNISLLLHDGKRWNVSSQFQFN